MDLWYVPLVTSFCGNLIRYARIFLEPCQCRTAAILYPCKNRWFIYTRLLPAYALQFDLLDHTSCHSGFAGQPLAHMKMLLTGWRWLTPLVPGRLGSASRDLWTSGIGL